MSNIDRVDWRQNAEEQAASAKVIAQLEDAIKAAPKTAPEYQGEERRKSARETRRQTLARCLVNLNTALATLSETGLLNDSANLWLIEGIDSYSVLKVDGYYGAKGQVTIPEWRNEKLRVVMASRSATPQTQTVSEVEDEI